MIFRFYFFKTLQDMLIQNPDLAHYKVKTI